MECSLPCTMSGGCGLQGGLPPVRPRREKVCTCFPVEGGCTMFPPQLHKMLSCTISGGCGQRTSLGPNQRCHGARFHGRSVSVLARVLCFSGIFPISRSTHLSYF